VAAKKSFSRRGGWSEHISDSYRSGLEEGISKQLTDAGVAFQYEQYYLKYLIPESDHTYTPDFLLPNGIVVESKGLFEPDDRKKHLLIKKQYPHLDIRFVFDNPNNKINKGSKTTYAMWCDKNGYKYARKYVPFEWIKETAKDTTGLLKKPDKKAKG
jgi:hypothetical protein